MTEAVRLIMSGAVVGQELAAEFGPLPPAFLPVGSKRLYELQLAELSGAGPVWMVLPETFAVSDYDAERLAALGAQVLAIPEGLRLGEAVVYALGDLALGDRPLHILHGDTLITAPPTDGLDLIVGGDSGGDYSWAQIDVHEGRIAGLEVIAAGEDGGGRPVAAGYFAFSSSLELVRAITRQRGDFIAGVGAYAQGREMVLWPARRWLDFGHLQTFFRSRLAATTARAFNSLAMDGFTARKSSADADKMRAEARWLRNAPSDVQIYCARMIEAGETGGRGFYLTEYEYLPVLSELFVHGAIGRGAWLRILQSCETFLTLCAGHVGEGSGDEALSRLAVDKTFERLEMLARAGFAVDREQTYEGRPCPSLRGIAEILAGEIDLAAGKPARLMHGDFCFSNVLYASRLRRIKVIDPRGSVDGTPSLWGDPRYDLAKLAHSIIGRYDQIIAGRCRVRRSGDDHGIDFEPLAAQAWLEDALADLTIDGYGAASGQVKAVMTGLFLSAPPLHADRPDRQQALIANALRLFLDLDRS